jgi:hypothetical protein
MIIRLNNGKTLNIVEKSLIVRNGKLFNVVTKEYEGVDGDDINFCIPTTSGGKCWVFGVVDGYTCNRRIVMRGSKTPYAMMESTNKNITHKSRIVETDGVSITESDEELEPVKVESDWELVLKA